ncbi:hypothetical protein EW145_g1689 [Phellinidium pouzarii]|uniref:Uncharacterized protein n=1 Tax=Phellinidium pouzarii TaxID=167371 RepID=A0A4S4LE48_9AGAM|nr:hypothetical protein EW145_g1689 [Phellinidium pouzarii]
MTSILLAMGLLPQYWEIFRLGEVRGISITFIVIDTLGGVFSLLSLVFKPKFDILAGVAYSLVVVLDSAVVILAIILNPRAKRQRRRLTEADAEHRFQSGSTSSLDDTGAGHRELTTIDSRVSSTRSSHRNDVLNPVHLETDKEETLGEVQDEKLNEQ